jgi:hypothetical protein
MEWTRRLKSAKAGLNVLKNTRKNKRRDFGKEALRFKGFMWR